MLHQAALGEMGKSIDQQMTEQLVGPQTISQRYLDALVRLVRAAGSASDMIELIDRTGRQLAEIFDSERAVLFVHDLQRQRLWTWRGSTQGSRSFDDEHGLCGHVLATHEPVLIEDVSDNTLHVWGPCPDLGDSPDQLRSVMAAPVMFEPTICRGVIEVADARPGRFDQGDLALLQAAAAYIGVALHNVEQFEAQQRQFDTAVRAVVGAIDARDAITRHNSINVANYAMAIGQILGLSNTHVESLRMAGMLHDVGKIGTPDRILTKAGRLEPEEFDQVTKHADYTRHILSQIEFAPPYQDMAALAAAHHERLDGSGYPDALAGNQVPLKVRILAVADVFHALTQPRRYRSGLACHAALSVLDDLSPQQLDARCVAALKTFFYIGDMPTAAA